LTVVLLQHHNVAFRRVDVTGDEKLISTLNAAGHTTLPVVVVGNDVWTGYRPDKIKALLRREPIRTRGRSA
jgi:glutaredoxin-like protein NrdH